MNPKEKAQNLYDKFYLSIGNIYSQELGINSYTEQKIRATKCALTAVEEILQIKVLTLYPDAEEFTVRSHKEYWEEVKTEINKL